MQLGAWVVETWDSAPGPFGDDAFVSGILK